MEITGQWAREGRRAFPTRGLRFTLRWLIKLPLLVLLVGFRHARLSALIVVASFILWFVGSGAVLSTWTNLQQPQSAAASPQRFSTNAEMASAPEAAEQYMLGQSRYDADTMWSSISEDAKRGAGRNGALTLQALRQQLAEQKQSGVQYDEVSYIGGHLTPDGRGFYLYLVRVSSGSDVSYVPYTFTIGRDGKILGIS